MVMNTLQLGRSLSSVPSNTNDASRARTAAWISDTCCATTLRTLRWERGRGWELEGRRQRFLCDGDCKRLREQSGLGRPPHL
jgi:hypothetical protein